MTKTLLRTVAVSADDRSLGTTELSGLWQALVGGKRHVVDAFHFGGRYFLVLRRAPAGAPPRPSVAPRNLDIVERVLTGTGQKVVALDNRIAVSTVSLIVADALRAMGLSCSAGKVPLGLVVLVHSARSGSVRWVGRTSMITDTLQIVSVPRPDLALEDELSPGECAVVRRVIEGKTYAEIARERGASPRTVANQLASAFRRLGVSGRLELMAHLVLRATAFAAEPPSTLRPLPPLRVEAPEPWTLAPLEVWTPLALARV